MKQRDKKKLVRVRCNRDTGEWVMEKWKDHYGWEFCSVLSSGTLRNVRFSVEQESGCGYSNVTGYAIGELVTGTIYPIRPQQADEIRSKGEAIAFDTDKECFVRRKTSTELLAVYELNLLPKCSSSVIVKKPRLFKKKQQPVSLPNWQETIEEAHKPQRVSVERY